MKATQLLGEDHERVRALFHAYESADEGAREQKQRIVEEVLRELQVHTHIEEEFFYPAVKAKAGHEGEELVAESRQEHHVVEMLMDEMRGLRRDNPEYDAKFKVLMENVQHHADEEEQEMFPLAEKRLGDELNGLGERLQQRKDELTATAR